MDQNLISLRDAFTFARIKYKNHYLLFIAIMFTFFAIWVLLEIIVFAGQKLGIVFWAVAHLVFFMVFAGLQVGFIQICLAVVEGRAVSYSNLFSSLSLGVRFFMAQLFYLALCLVGFVLLIIPGFYWLTQYTMNGFCMAAHSTDLLSSFQNSAQISKNSKFSLFILLMAIILLNLVGASLLGVGLFVTVPVSVLVKTYVFKQLESSAAS